MLTYLNVRYDDRHVAKSHGACWNAKRKQWYYEGGNLPEELKQFLKEKEQSGDFRHDCDTEYGAED